MEEKLAKLRDMEVDSLRPCFASVLSFRILSRSYWNLTCALTSIMLLFPRLLIWPRAESY